MMDLVKAFLFQDFLRRNFKDKDDKYEEMIPVSHEPGKLYATSIR